MEKLQRIPPRREFQCRGKGFLKARIPPQRKFRVGDWDYIKEYILPWPQPSCPPQHQQQFPSFMDLRSAGKN